MDGWGRTYLILDDAPPGNAYISFIPPPGWQLSLLYEEDLGYEVIIPQEVIQDWLVWFLEPIPGWTPPAVTPTIPPTQQPTVTPQAQLIDVFVDGNELAFDVPPQVTDGRTLVPLRAIFEALGAEVSWNADTQTVTGTKGGTTVVLPIGSTTPTVNGLAVTIDVAGSVVDGRTLVPLRFVAESFGVTVNWDAVARLITITS